MSRNRRRSGTLPRATYRIQLHSDFTFGDATAILPYLKRLGISHVYCSPYLAARPGSRHGYDITNHADFNAELGGREGFERFAEALQQNAMGHILDFVPNHMGVGKGDNPWWLDVLEWGRASPFASFFDIDWEPIKPELYGKVMLPFLGDHYGTILEAGEFKLNFQASDGTFAVDYHEHRTPISPPHYARILAEALAELRRTGEEPELFDAFDSLLAGFAGVSVGAVSGQRRELSRIQAVDLKRKLADLVQDRPRALAAIDAALRSFNGMPGDPSSFQALHRLLEAQAYRWCYWRAAADEINYRRFFDVNDLASLRVESQDVFASIHSLVLSLIESGKLQGLRIDHVDGLYDPFAYCRRVRSRLDSARRRGDTGASGYLVVEKILAADEKLPADWPIDGTTGYDFMNEVQGLFIERQGRGAINAVYRQFLGSVPNYDHILYDSKMYVMKHMLASELLVLATELDRIAKANWRSRDMTLSTLRDALAEVVAHFPVYRTYVTGGGASDEDRRHIGQAIEAAIRASIIDPEVFRFIRDVLTTDLVRQNRAGYSRQRVIRFAMKFQQYSSPVMAKGSEDTAFYRFHRLIVLNEVGGDPRRYGVSLAEFHERNATRAEHWPGAMLATMTHDAKRGEDIRARLCVLSEIAEDWAEAALSWRRINGRAKPRIERIPAPDPNDEFLLYQTLLGSWPIEFTGRAPDTPAQLETYRGRLHRYMTKAIRESKLRSSWIRPDTVYEDAVGRFIDRILDPADGVLFLREFIPFQARIAEFGVVNGLAQTLLRLTAPGVPDTFQGAELWDLRLVDPDNRAPVDYARRSAMLEELETSFASRLENPSADGAAALMANWRDGRIKLYVQWHALSLRRRHPNLFAGGSYVPLRIDGPRARQVFAFARVRGNRIAIVAVPRLIAGLGRARPADVDWGDTTILLGADLYRAAFHDVIAGGRMAVRPRRGGGALAVSALFEHLPLALLITEVGSDARRRRGPGSAVL